MNVAPSDMRFVTDPAQWALFLDIDGTLLEIEPTPLDVVAPPELIVTLEKLAILFNGAVALVTGRRIEDADRILAPLQLTAAGIHGAQMRRYADGPIVSAAPPVSARLLHKVAALASGMPGVVVEGKGAGIAVHYRMAPAVRPQLEEGLRHIVRQSRQAVMFCQGRMVYEIIPAECSKRAAIELLCKLPRFEGRLPLVIGDDAPDETAILLADMRGGVGLKVAGEHFPAAVADFTGPLHVRQSLEGLVRRFA